MTAMKVYSITMAVAAIEIHLLCRIVTTPVIIRTGATTNIVCPQGETFFYFFAFGYGAETTISVAFAFGFVQLAETAICTADI